MRDKRLLTQKKYNNTKPVWDYKGCMNRIILHGQAKRFYVSFYKFYIPRIEQSQDVVAVL